MHYTTDELRERLRQSGLASYIPQFEPQIRPSIRITLQDAPADPMPLGASKLGGLPDLPPDVDWPECIDSPIAAHRPLRLGDMGGPLCFLMQIRLEELSTFDTEPSLPATGMLYFFAALHRDGFPSDGVTPDCWRVLYFDGDLSTLRRAPSPLIPPSLQKALTQESSLPASCMLPESALSFALSYLLPSNPDIEMTEEERITYRDAFWEVFHGQDNVPEHRMLGYAGELQGLSGDMEFACECAMPQVEFPFKTMTREAWSQWDAFKKERAERARDWHLLLQLDTEPERKLFWPGWGRGYFWITRSALKDRRFDRVCLINEQT